jgi:methyl-accepting chemotaxis protein
MTNDKSRLKFEFKRIGTRLGAGFGIVLALMVLMVVAAALQLWRIQSHNADNERHTARLVLLQEWAGQVRTNLDRALMVTRLEAQAGDDDVLRGRLGPMFTRLADDMAQTAAANAALQKQVELVSDEPTVKGMISQINGARQRFVTLRGQIGDDLQMGEGAARIDNELQPLAQTLVRAIDQLTAYLKQRSADATAELKRNVDQARVILLVICAVTLAAGGLIAWLSTRAITQPMHDAVAMADRIAQGDLTQIVESTRQDEIGSMLRRLAGMQQRLRQAFGDISQATAEISHASREVASGNADLSQRTEQAASSLQETASSMEQLTGTVRHSAESARAASELAGASTAVAQRGGKVVAQVVATMGEINQSSSQIASIIGVIDSIAFQTNILALNAAVEAARAGEQGRGFAVVAAEVRSLAQRSAEAAREIKALIDASVDKVGAGARLVQEAGSTMEEIVASVQRVTHMIEGISASALEQNQGIGKMNQAVGQLDQMTQQNAALVEQSTAAAESLKDQAQRLAGIVATFRLA